MLRITLYQPSAHFKVPFSYKLRLTYPLPLYSTVVGFLCNVLGITNQKSSEFQSLINSKIAIVSQHKTKFQNLRWFRSIVCKENKKCFENRIKNNYIHSVGSVIPCKEQLLEDVTTIIYIHNDDVKFLEYIENCAKSGEKRLSPLHLGRVEDLVIIKECKLIRGESITQENTKELFKYYTWIPEQVYDMKGNVLEINWNNLTMPIYYIPKYFYIPDFEKHLNRNANRVPVCCKVKLNNGYLLYEGNVIIDKDYNAPIFLGGLK